MIILFIGLVYDGVGAYFIAKPLLSEYLHFREQRKALEEFRIGDFKFLEESKIHETPMDIFVNQRIQNFFDLQSEFNDKELTISTNYKSCAEIGLYFIFLGISLIIISNII